MRINQTTLYLLVSSSLGFILGLSVPMCFALLDLSELGMKFDYTNTMDILKSQKIYTFSLLAFPSLFTLLSYYLTSSKITNKKLNTQREFTNNVLDSMEDYLFTVDKSYALELQNKKTHDSNNELVDIVYKHDSYLNLVTSRAEHYEVEFNDKYYLVSFSSSQNQEQHLGILSLKDITSLKEQQNVIDTKNKEIEVSSRMSALGEIAAGVAHEINNPLAIIQGNISLLIAKYRKSKKLDLKQVEICEDKIADNVDRISNIIRNLRNLASAGESSNTSCNLEELLEKCEPIVSNVTNTNAIEFIQEINIPKSTEIQFNPIEFTQILFNLVSNSKDAMHDFKGERWIKMIVDLTDNEVVFRIVDSGEGIPMEQASKIFTPLFTTKDFGKGSGLGLSLSGMLAKKNDAILVYDKHALNTTFVIKTKVVSEGQNFSDEKIAA